MSDGLDQCVCEAVPTRQAGLLQGHHSLDGSHNALLQLQELAVILDQLLDGDKQPPADGSAASTYTVSSGEGQH